MNQDGKLPKSKEGDEEKTIMEEEEHQEEQEYEEKENGVRQWGG